ncbi:MAG: hypothetical protein JNK82_22635 [Myxococcaceae bacterium]|nr:hypothetical protein [Myxococcaceae bacterium]
MLLTISTTHSPATDLGYLLHKNPARPQSVDLSFGKAHVFYPEATETRCTVALLLEVDPVGLVRDRRGPAGDGGALEQYVNDRPYVASSFMSVAISRVFGSALSGTCKERAELVTRELPVPEAEWLNNTICVDTGCAYGGKLTALRYPEREIVSVAAARVYCEPKKPLIASAPALSAQHAHDDVLDLEDVSGKRLITTRLQHSITIREENVAAALGVESLERFVRAEPLRRAHECAFAARPFAKPTVALSGQRPALQRLASSLKTSNPMA